MAFKRIALVSLSSMFLLAGCGEGYEVIKTNTMFPYGNERTAGSGVAYVLAKMMPKKELKLEAVDRDWKPEVMEMLPAEEPAPVPAEPPKPAEPEKADKLFLDDGKK